MARLFIAIVLSLFGVNAGLEAIVMENESNMTDFDQVTTTTMESTTTTEAKSDGTTIEETTNGPNGTGGDTGKPQEEVMYAKVTGSMELTVPDPAGFVANTTNAVIAERNLAKSLKLDATFVDVELSVGRRLSGRSLQDGIVIMKYTITIPVTADGATSAADAADAMVEKVKQDLTAPTFAETFKAAINEELPADYQIADLVVNDDIQSATVADQAGPVGTTTTAADDSTTITDAADDSTSSGGSTGGGDDEEEEGGSVLQSQVAILTMFLAILSAQA